MPLQPIELVSFKICPFVQRSVITLRKKNIEFKTTYIDLADKPDWFLKLSPLGKVPIVKYGSEVLFESAVINEFLDEITPNPIMPTDPLRKAQDRGWIEYSSTLLGDQYAMYVAKTTEDFEKAAQTLSDRLRGIEEAVALQGYFAGDRFSLVDCALAPLFTRFDIISRRYDRDFLRDLPRLSALSTKLLAHDFVQESVVSDFDDIFVGYLKRSACFLEKAQNPSQ